MPLFSRKKDRSKKDAAAQSNGALQKPKWEDAWVRTRVDPEEVAELLHGCTQEIKSRALDVPFLLLPFRPSSDPSAARTFIRNYFYPPADRKQLTGPTLMRELRMTEVMVLVAVMKWCWARLPGGVVTWEAYQGFKVGERDSKFARNAYNTFIPISVESNSRLRIINDFFDLLTALAAHGKTNGLGGHKLSRYGGWWAFDHYDTGKGFEAGYKLWSSAADAASHLFFAYLRSQAPDPGRTNGVLDLPRSLQQLVDSMSYPPPSSIVSNDTTKVVMIVDVVSPTPFALLRRAKQFEYRDDDIALQHFAEFEDPVQALTEECRRVLRAISSANQSSAVSDAKTSTSLRDPSWSRFEDIGFGSTFDGTDEGGSYSQAGNGGPQALSTISRTGNNDLGRPTTPSWADFLSSGFVDENGNKAPVPILLPPDKALPPMVASRGQSSQSHRRDLDDKVMLEPGELASISHLDLDDAFWWVWISSLAGEEPVTRKAAFGRCALVETTLLGGQWMIMEEQVKGAGPEPDPNAYVAERKSFFSFTRKGRLTRRRSAVKKSPLSEIPNGRDPSRRLTIEPEKQAKIQEAAAELSRQRAAEEKQAAAVRRGRTDENANTKTNSILTLGPMIRDEASPAMQWTKQYDKKAIREQYLGNELAGKGSTDFLTLPNGGVSNSDLRRSVSTVSVNKDLPPAPSESAVSVLQSPTPVQQERQVELLPKAKMVPELDSQPMTQEAPSQRYRQPSPAPPIVVEKAPLPAQTRPPPVKPNSSAVNIPLPGVGGGAVSNLKSAYEQKQAAATEPKPVARVSTDRHRLKKPIGPGPPLASANKPNGIKRLFGTMRKNKDTAGLPVPDSPTDEDPAVAAARRALEGKPARPGDGPTSPPLSPNHFAKLQSSKPKPQEHVSEAPTPVEPTYEAPPVEMPSNEPVVQREPESHFAREPEHYAPQPASYPTPDAEEAFITPMEAAPLHTHQEEDSDNLSKVDTLEREHADREFSRFDQGPLVDQPEFLPSTDSLDEVHEQHPPAFEPPLRPKHQSVYSAVTIPSEAEDDQPREELSQQVSAHDRWAQIRKNAAERAARASEEQGRSRTETRTTDDGETSGEETIESRVARIKARVAELTGNMDANRR